MDADSTPTWVNMTDAARARGCSPAPIARAAIAGQVRTKLVPGLPPRYALEDVKRLEMLRAVRPRKVQPIGA